MAVCYGFKVIRIGSRQMAEASAPSVVRDAAMAQDEVYDKNVSWWP